MQRRTALAAIIMVGTALQLGACAKSEPPGASSLANGPANGPANDPANGNDTLNAPAPSSTPAPTPASKAVPLPAGTSAGVRIYFDPVTGEQRAPTDEELAAEAQRASELTASPAVKPSLKVQERVLPGGITEVQIDRRADVQERVCVQPDGSLSGDCPTATATPGKAKQP
jgi:hypothetical protein